MSPDVSPKQSQQHIGSANLVKRSKLSRPVETSFAESMHKSIKLSPPNVGLDSGKQAVLYDLSFHQKLPVIIC